MEYIRLTKENLDTEHICCAISNNGDVQVSSKKNWLNDRLDEGLEFIKSTERGKCFIEYIPAVNAWVPIDADEYDFIDCLWVSGSFKGHGYSNDLLNICMDDARNRGYKGLCVLSSDKKMPFLSDPRHLAYKGFKVADKTDAGINLMYLPFTDDAEIPKFKESARELAIEEKGFVLFYTNQCPFTAKYVPIIEKIAEENKVEFKSVHIDCREKAQSAPCPVTTYALFIDGKYYSNEILSDKKFLKLIEEYKKEK